MQKATANQRINMNKYIKFLTLIFIGIAFLSSTAYAELKDTEDNDNTIKKELKNNIQINQCLEVKILQPLNKKIKNLKQKFKQKGKD